MIPIDLVGINLLGYFRLLRACLNFAQVNLRIVFEDVFLIL